MQFGNVTHFKGIGYVCFLDILGFSQDIQSNWNALKSNPLDKLLAIKSALSVLHEDDVEPHESKSMRSYVCRVNTVSDSITIAFGVEEKKIIGDMVLGLEVLLANVREVWRTAIHLGYTLRGAIDYGDIYWDKNELVGPAFINAYRLESEIARVSRVIVSSKLNMLLSDLAVNYSGGLTEHLIANFRKDVDGYIVVDPYKICTVAEERKLLASKLRTMAMQTTLPLLKEKYAPLINMLLEAPSPPIDASQLGRY
ncbi:NH(3)-dependent NAD(+) synthetase [Pseudomonas monteilii]|uniref:NH(3)-dependent NAD(+) synthetase n=1 Tax=Pseudomonas monteilii TaxID=76759 RepID=A0AAE6RBS4_9PSED|nr:hypothetical protein [Pseudomonas monteilii]QHB28153.1 NH(3)-dependent NAD(+) synthetase [Pseudomonas monteilii]